MKQEIIRIDLGGVNSYLGKQGDNFILFDVGGHMTMDKIYDDRCEKLEKELVKAGCTSENLKLIVLTHGDNDHVANADYFRNKYQSKIAMHSNDLALVESPTLGMMMDSFKFNSIIYKIVIKLMNKQILKMNSKVLSDFVKFTPDIFIDEGDSLSEYGFDAKVLHIPGHTTGSIGILTLDGELIAGDTFANMKNPAPAINANDFKQLFESINRLKSMNIKTVYQGHGEPFKMTEYKK